MLDLKKVKKIYFVGIGGIGMSAAAGIAKAKGYQVSGSDSNDIYEPSKSILKHFEIPYAVGYSARNYSGADLIVATSAVDSSNPEIAKAMQTHAVICTYPELLGLLAADKRRIVVAGTHGKGTTSGLLGYTLKNLNDSSFFVGAALRQPFTNFYYGKGPDFVIEGDEYKSGFNDNSPKFMYYKPDILLLNNLELDHPDIYPNIETLKNVFSSLITSMPKTGIIVYNFDDKNAVELASASKLKKISFGFRQGADLRAEPPVLDSGNFLIKAYWDCKELLFSTRLPGMPYAYDNLAALATLIAAGYQPENFLDYFESYQGVKRRYEILQESPVVLIDDYAHHPTAVKQTLAATRKKYPDSRIICYFEPHTYSRTAKTLDDLARSFGAANIVYIAEVYPAREQKLPSSVTGQQVVAEISKHQPNVYYVENKDQALKKIKKELKADDVIIAMTVGDSGTKLLEDLMLQ